MARSYTIAEIKTRARRKANMENTNFIKDDEILDYINEAYASLYDLLVSKTENYFVSENQFTISSATDLYNLPNDFYKIISVDFRISESHWVGLKSFTENERNSFLGGTASIPTGTIRVRYVPAPAKFTSDSQSIDGISGWEALLVTDVAIMMLEKEESSTTALERRKAELMKRIEQIAQNRDLQEPGRVSDVYQIDTLRRYNSIRYRLYGNSIRFLSTEYVSAEFFF